MLEFRIIDVGLCRFASSIGGNIFLILVRHEDPQDSYDKLWIPPLSMSRSASIPSRGRAGPVRSDSGGNKQAQFI